MGETIKLTAADGNELDAYRADPGGASKGGIVVIQEIFGVYVHVRDVCDRLSSEGYTALAPALFDRTSLESSSVILRKILVRVTAICRK